MHVWNITQVSSAGVCRFAFIFNLLIIKRATHLLLCLCLHVIKLERVGVTSFRDEVSLRSQAHAANSEMMMCAPLFMVSYGLVDNANQHSSKG